MNEKEIAEIRRIYKADKINIPKIRGCYVNEKGEILTEFSQPLVAMLEDEATEILQILKKTLSGTLGKNLIDIDFINKQVLQSPEHKLLMDLRTSALADDNAVHELYGKIINSVKTEGSYLIFLANDKYDVFSYSADGKKEEDSSTVFSYIICCVCPLKLTKTALSFYPLENSFHNIAANTVVDSPELGFMFPSFDDRMANLYSALFYTKNTAASHSAFLESIFNCEIPMPATQQKEAFNSIITDTVADDKKLDVIKAVQDEVCYMLEERKATKDTRPPKISKDKLKSVLKSRSVSEDELSVFEERYNQSFGEKYELCPQNIVDTKKLTVETPDISIKISSDRSDIIKTKIIDGEKYILIRADENITVNGVNVSL